jgi:hypothetical protein
MYRRTFLAAFALASVVMFARAAGAADDATLLRIFLTDGSSLVSYGELARVGDRVVFSMPTGSLPNPPLQLVNISAARVDWDRTNRYAVSARAARYLETQADVDYAALSNDVAQALNDVTATTDPARRVVIVENARKILAAWPESHYNFRAAEVRQMLSMLDEAIADLRAATGGNRFDLRFVAFADPTTIAEPLLPSPTPMEAIEAVLSAARVVDSPAERTSLLGTILITLDHESAALPAEWAMKTRVETETRIQTELRIDRSYQLLTKRTIALGARRAGMADVRGVQRLVDRIHRQDQVLGGQRPDAVAALLSAVDAQLDAARRLRLARDRWTLRAPFFSQYRIAIKIPMDRFAGLKPSLEDIKALAGTSPATLDAIQRAVSQIAKQASAIVPPEEFIAAHAVLVSATQLAANAAQIRREATLAGDMARAWDASSAAAGALMLGARARSDIQALLRPPRLP